MYLTKRLKYVTTLIKEIRILSFTKILGITTRGIKEIIINVLNHKTLQQKKKNFPIPLIKKLHRGNQREPLKCQECGEPHYFKDYHIRNSFFNNVHSIQEASTVGDMERSMPRISVALENKKSNHQVSMVEIEGMIKSHPISILIDPSASLSYVSPRIVELFKLSQKKFEKSWLVQLATCTK